jgi:two-component system phosphate regulon sensor histidine kinase PhoR
VQSESKITNGAYHSYNGQNGDGVAVIRREMQYLNTIGKRFVAAVDRFQVHRALLAALQELYSFAACSILLKGDPIELSIIPRYPLSEAFLEAVIKKIVRAANVMDFPQLTAEELALNTYLDAPDEFAHLHKTGSLDEAEVGDSINIPLTVENRIIGMLSLFDEHPGTFDAEQLQLITMIADYAAVALENVRLRESEMALWRQAENERRRLELVISSMAEGLFITDAEGVITLLNVSAQRLFDQAQVELKQGIPLRKMATSNDAEWLQDLARIVEQALVGKVVMNEELIAGVSGEAVPLTLSVSVAPLHDSSLTQQPRPVGAVAVLNDVTSSKQIEKLKDEFVSVVSHELRTPLTAIKGYTQHLLRRIERRLRETRRTQPLDGSPAVEPPESYDLRSLNIVQSQAGHLERLVNDLLDQSRVQWGQLRLDYSTFYLADVLAERVYLAQVSAEQHTILLDVQVQDSKIVADRLRMGQVVGNILDNAVKYSPQGGQVVVVLQEFEGDYLVSVIDQGIGINPEYLDHIFERFYRVRNTANRQYSGIGLGLYVTKAIIESHGGRIWHTSNQGRGSIFHFTLPPAPRTS